MDHVFFIHLRINSVESFESVFFSFYVIKKMTNDNLLLMHILAHLNVIRTTVRVVVRSFHIIFGSAMTTA